MFTFVSSRTKTKTSKNQNIFIDFYRIPVRDDIHDQKIINYMYRIGELDKQVNQWQKSCQKPVRVTPEKIETIVEEYFTSGYE